MIGNRENVGNRDVKCFRCGKMGHMISECRWANGACFSCGQVGHMAMNCTDPQRAGCRRCGGMDHWARDCQQGGRVRKPVCGNCGIEGHFSRMCRVPRNTCTQCGQMGHLAGMCWSIRRQGSMNPGYQGVIGREGSRPMASSGGTANIVPAAAVTSNRTVNVNDMVSMNNLNNQVRGTVPGNEEGQGLQMVGPHV